MAVWSGPFRQVGRGMRLIPKGILPYLVRKAFLGPGWPTNTSIGHVYGSVRKTGHLHFSGVRYFDTPHPIQSPGRTIGDFRRLWSPIKVAEICGWIIPMKATTPVGIVADYLLDEGQEETDMYRLLMWFHNLHN